MVVMGAAGVMVGSGGTPFGVTASFCGSTGLTAVAAPVGLGVALAANLAFSSGLKAW